MLKLLLCFCAFVFVAFGASFIKEKYDYDTRVEFDSLPPPEDLAMWLSEDEFEDYLDYYLYQEYLDSIKDQQPVDRSACNIPISSLREPLPVYASGGSILKGDGNSGIIRLTASQAVGAGCAATGLTHSAASTTPESTTLSCVSGTSVSSTWTSRSVDIAEILCLTHPTFTTAESGGSCSGGGVLIDAFVSVGSTRYSVLSSCFHRSRAEVFYVMYPQNPENVIFQPSVGRPTFVQGSHYPGLSVNDLYTQNLQKVAFDRILGNNMNLVYINATYFLARGHLAAKTDKVMAPEQRASFTFVNAAPQWQPFNGGNWNTLEQRLRARIGATGYRTTVYTGTHGILRLRDSSGVFRDMYLSPATGQIPVPMWFYKVVYEPTTRRGVVYLGLNNPHVTLAEARQLAFCTDVCTGNSAFSWLTWQPTNIGLGFSLCCAIDDFRRTVTVLPAFTTSGILA